MKKKSKIKYEEEVYPAKLVRLGGPLSIFCPWLPTVFAFMPVVSLCWLSPDKQVVSLEHQSLN